MKIAKVIATCFKSKNVILKTKLTGNPLGYYYHSQNFVSTQDIIDLIKLHIEIEATTDPGIDLDIIIVNSDVGDIEGNNFINSLDNKKLLRGKIITFNRKNQGLSFGAYSDAFEKFRNKYEYFLFTEDDVLIYKNNYAKYGVDLLNSENKFGFVAYVGVTKLKKEHIRLLNLNDSNGFSCHGGIGLSSTKILNKIFKKQNKLPHYNGTDYQKGIFYGEILFTADIVKEGYDLVDLPEDKIFSIPAYDYMRNIKYRKKPNIFEIVYFYIKRLVYITFSINPSLQKFYFKILKFLKINN